MQNPLLISTKSDDFLKKIFKRYEKIKDKVNILHDKHTVYTKSKHELSKGCQACKNGKWVCLRMGYRCNLNCLFCKRARLNIHEDEPKGILLKMSLKKLCETILKQSPEIEGVAYSGGEPLLYLDKVLPIAKILNKENPNIYQWLYTNGKLLKEKHLRDFQKVGIKEIRVNLLASHFDKEVMKKLPLIKDIIGKVTIEIPSLPETYDKLIGDGFIFKISEYAEQLNLAEFFISHLRGVDLYKDKEGYILKYKKNFFISPIESRNITIDVIEFVIENKIPILVNDCSNCAKILFWKKMTYPAKTLEIFYP